MWISGGQPGVEIELSLLSGHFRWSGSGREDIRFEGQCLGALVDNG